MNFPQDLSGNYSISVIVVFIVIVVLSIYLFVVFFQIFSNKLPFLELCKLVSDSSAIYNDSQDLGIVDSDEDFKLDVKYV